MHLQQKDELMAPSGNHLAASPSLAAAQDSSKHPDSRRQSIVGPSSPVLPKAVALPPAATSTRTRPAWPISTLQHGGRPFPPELLGMLDGDHHTDELAVQFEAGWPVLEGWLVAAGGGRGDGDFGRVCIIYQ